MLRHRAYIVVVTLFVIVSLSGCTNNMIVDPPASTNSLQDARNFAQNQRYSAAIKSYKAAINEDPTNIDAYIEAANIYILKNNTGEALAILENGQENTDSLDRIFEKAGEIYFSAGEYDDAIEVLNKSIETNPNSGEAQIYLSLSYAGKADVENAKSTLLESAEYDSEFETYKYLLLGLYSYDDPDQILKYATSAEGVGDEKYEEKAKALKNVALEMLVNTDDTVYVNTLISYQLITNDLYALAVPILDQTLKLNDEHWTAYMYLAVAQMNMGNYDLAATAAETALGINPSSAELNHLLGQVYTYKNDQKKSIEFFERALDLDSQNEEIRYNYVKALEKFKLNSQTVAQYKFLINLESLNYLKYNVELGRIYLDETSEFQAAQDLMYDVINKWGNFTTLSDSEKSDVYDVYAWSYEKLDQRDKAIEALNLALEYNDKNAEALYHLGVINLDMKDFVTAKDHLEAAIDYDLDGKISKLSTVELNKI